MKTNYYNKIIKDIQLYVKDIKNDRDKEGYKCLE